MDGSVQPYAVIIPARYDPARPSRLDVVLHGSSKPVGMSELRFVGRFDVGDGPAAGAPDRDYIELHPLGRVENGYRWAGEADVLEAIEAACRNYNVDRDRIVLRGMSMGASAVAWPNVTRLPRQTRYPPTPSIQSRKRFGNPEETVVEFFGVAFSECTG